MLENVQVGDTLILNGRGRASDAHIVKVDRLTKTQIIINSNRFRKFDGRVVGGGSIWNSLSVTIPREGEIKKIQEARLRLQLEHSINDACQIQLVRKMSLDTLQQLSKILENQ